MVPDDPTTVPEGGTSGDFKVRASHPPPRCRPSRTISTSLCAAVQLERTLWREQRSGSEFVSTPSSEAPVPPLSSLPSSIAPAAARSGM